MDIRASNDYLILERIEAPERIGGIMLPEANREACRQRPVGHVLSVGPKVNDVGCEDPIEVGDTVLFDDRAAACCHGLDGDLRSWVKVQFVVGKVVSDQHATAEKMKRDKERYERLKSEREASENLVRAAGQLNGATR